LGYNGRIQLTHEETRFMESLTAQSVEVARGCLIQRAGQPVTHAFALLTGWAMTYSDFADGTRQIRRLHFPGDLLAMPSMAMRHHVENVEALTDVVFAPFERDRLAELFLDYPRLAAIMFIFAQEERITYGDRLCSLVRYSCKARIAFLLLDILARLRAVDPSIANSFELHLTRAQMGEVTGMTPVHASRMWNSLIGERLISFDNGFVTIEDESRLVELSGFSSRSPGLDFSWILDAQDRSARGGASMNGASRLTG
jgi:CRP/FNR family transcriptional regulator, anaerobic regulatory protein